MRGHEKKINRQLKITEVKCMVSELMTVKKISSTTKKRTKPKTVWAYRKR